MGLYQHIRELWQKPKQNLGQLYKDRLVEWRRQPSTVRIEKPTRLDRARSVGYRAKQGVLVVRQRVIRGGRQREKIRGPRRPKRMSRRKDLKRSYQTVAEQRASLQFPNCEVLNSYLVVKDGRYAWYEVILIDRAHPSVGADAQLSGLTTKGRVQRGLTSSARKSRGLSKKGKGREKMRPSLRAHNRRGT